jgi:beta-lactamase class A
MQGAADSLDAVLDGRLRQISDRVTAGTIGVSVYDYLSGLSWQFNGDRWFHAASVIKLAILVALYDAANQARFSLGNRLHVRNRFLSVADGMPFRIDPNGDADGEVHAALGRTMLVRQLARRMIITSSNLATNLLVNLVGLEHARETMKRLEIEGVELNRGVEDERAFEQGISNRMTPNGAVALLRAIFAAKGVSPEASEEMNNLLLDQQFSGTIGPGLPDHVRPFAKIAHKTGEISTVTHDAGAVFMPSRPPYLVAIFVESAGDLKERQEAGIAASAAIWECVAAAGEGVPR